MKNKSKLEFYFPGWTRKSVTFTIDDGDIPNDIKFLNIVRPAGILGTFNISSPTKATPEEYREIYRGYEIANHCANHPLVMEDNQQYIVAEEDYDPETAREYSESDPVIYRTSVENVYRIVKGDKVRRITDKENYFKFACQNRADLENIFGEGTVKGFVWPFKDPGNAWLYNKLCAEGYTYIRTGKRQPIAEQNFDILEDKTHWEFTARESNLLEAMNAYENYPDNGKLKIFSFGVHARDYENKEKWGELQEFVDRYAKRPNDYYYASNIDIIEYEVAVKALKITENRIENTSDKDVYMTVDGERVILKANSSIEY